MSSSAFPFPPHPRKVASIAVAVALAQYGAALAAPAGHQVVAGRVTVTAPSVQQTVITQASAAAIVNWQSFSIGATEHVDIRQPNASSVLLNRVIGNDPSAIYGRLSANGQVFLVNPNGVLFGRAAQVSVGALVASTLDIANDDFLAGRFHFAGNSAAGVDNQGSLQAGERGTIALLGGHVNNDGTISAQLGTAALVAGEKIALDFEGDGLTKIRVDQGAVAAMVANRGMIIADGGQAVMSAHAAQALADTVLNQQGTVRARSLIERDGKIVLDGGTTGVTLNSGALDASGSAGLKGGTVNVLGHHVGLVGNAVIDASGGAGGGQIFVGGGAQGGNPLLHHAAGTFAGPQATLRADALGKGDGGTVVLWSDGATRMFGTASATGGAQGGDGGFIETSGKFLDVAGAHIGAAGALGKAGTWLLDPYDVRITDQPVIPMPTSPNFTSETGVTDLNHLEINSALDAGTSVSVTAAGSGGEGMGSISVQAAITKTSGADAMLTLNAPHNIIVMDGIQIRSTATGGRLHVDFNADDDNSGNGAIVMGSGSSIVTFGGNVRFYGQSDPLAGFARGSSIEIADGVRLTGATIDTTIATGLGGSVSLRGKGTSFFTGDTANAYGVGVKLDSATILGDSGQVNITGLGGKTTTGVELSSSSVTTTNGGGIDIRARTGELWVLPGYATSSTALRISGGAISTSGGVLGGSSGAIFLSGEAPAFNAVNISGTAVIGSPQTTGNITLRALSPPSQGYVNGLETVLFGGTIDTSGSLYLRPGGVSEAGLMTEAPTVAIGLHGSAFGFGQFELGLTELNNVITRASSVVIGSAQHTGQIRVDGPALLAGVNVTLQNGGAGSAGIDLTNGFSAPGHLLTLATGGAVTQAGPITAGALLLHGSQPQARFQLTDAGNAFGNVNIHFDQAAGGGAGEGVVSLASSKSLSLVSLSGSEVDATNNLPQLLIADSTVLAGPTTLTAGGDVSVGQQVASLAADATLTLNAGNNIAVLPGYQIGSTEGKLNVDLNADADKVGGGAIMLGAGSGIRTNGGMVRLYGQGDPEGGFALGRADVAANAVLLDNATIDTRSPLGDTLGGDVLIRGKSVNFGYAYFDEYAAVNARSNTLITSGGGIIAITGNGQQTGEGVHLQGSTITAGAGGTVAIVGSGKTTSEFSLRYGTGLLVDGGSITAGAGVTLQGDSLYGHGIALDSVDVYAGPVAITGTGGLAGDGVSIAGGHISSGAGSIDIRGLGGPSPLVPGGAYGIGVTLTDAVVVAAVGNIALSGQASGGTGLSLAGLSQIGNAASSGNIVLRAFNTSGSAPMLALGGAIQTSGNVQLLPGGLMGVEPAVSNAVDIRIGGLPQAGTFGVSQASLSAAMQAGVGTVIIGSADHTGAIAVDASGNLDGAFALSLQNGGAGSAGISLSNGLAMPARTLTLASGGPVTQGGPIVAQRVFLRGTQARSSFALANPGNAVSQLDVNFAMLKGTAPLDGNVDFSSSIDLAAAAVVAGDLTLHGGADLTLYPGVSTLAGDAAVTLNAGRDILLFGSIAPAMTTGKVRVDFNADSDAVGRGTITLAPGAQIRTNGGAVRLYGQGNPLSGFAIGNDSAAHAVLLDNATIDTRSAVVGMAGGAVSIRGKSVGLGYAYFDEYSAVNVVSNSLIASGGGAITITGDGVQTGEGVHLQASTITAGAGGMVAIAGSGKTAGEMPLRYGTGLLVNGGSITAGAGVTLRGDSLYGHGVVMDGLDVYGGPVSITGTAGLAGDGVSIAGGHISSGAGSIDIRGLGGPAPFGSGGTYGMGVKLTDTVVVAAVGDIALSGEASGGTGLSLAGLSAIGSAASSGNIVLRAFNTSDSAPMLALGGAIQTSGNVQLLPGGLMGVTAAVSNAVDIRIGGLPVAGSFGLSQESLAALQPGVATLTIGSADHIGAIELTATGDFAGTYALNLQNGGVGSAGISLASGLVMPGRTLTLASGGPVTQGGPILAQRVLLQGTQARSRFALANPANAVSQLDVNFAMPKGTGAFDGNVDFSSSVDLVAAAVVAGDLTLHGGADLTLYSGISTLAGDAAVSLNAGRNILLLGDIAPATAAGKVRVDFNADADAVNGGTITLGSGSQIRTNGGAVRLYGQGDAFGGFAIGRDADAHAVLLDNATIDTRSAAAAMPGGAVSIRGKSAVDGSVYFDEYAAVKVGANSLITSGGGAIAITGNAQQTGEGVHLQASTITAGAGGTVAIAGFGKTAGGMPVRYGTGLLGEGSTIVAGAGVTLRGDSLHGHGVALDSVNVSGGPVSITGIGGLGGDGVLIAGTQVSGSLIDMRGRGGLPPQEPDAPYGTGVNLVDAALFASGDGTVFLSGEATGGAGLSLGGLSTIGNASTTGNVVLRALNTAAGSGSAPMLSLGGKIQTSGVLNVRPGGVSTAGALTEASGVAIQIGAPATASGIFSLSADALEAAIVPGLSGVVIGSDTHTGAITVDALSASYDLSLLNGGAGSGGINLAKGVSIPGRTLNLSSGGSVVQGGAIVADSLMLHGTQAESSFALGNAGNAVPHIGVLFDVAGAAGGAGGNVNFASSGNVRVGPASVRGFDAGTNAPYITSFMGTAAGTSFTVRAGADLDVQHGVTILGADGALALHAGGNISLAAGTRMAGAGRIDVDLDADAGGTGGGAIVLASGTAIDAQGGNVRMFGQGDAVGGFAAGVQLDHAVIDGGAVAIRGKRADGTGVLLDGSAINARGPVAITGIGSTQGVRLAASQLTSTGGLIDLRGRGADGVVLQDTAVRASDIAVGGEGLAGNGLAIRGASALGGPFTTGNIMLRALNAGGTGAAAMVELGGTIQTTGLLNLRPGGVSAGGALTEAPAVAINIGGAAPAGAFNLSQAALEGAIQPGLATLVVGSASHTGAIGVTASGPFGFGYDLTLQNGGAGSGGIALYQGLDIGGRLLTLSSGGSVIQAAPISAASLLVHGTQPLSRFELRNPGNAITRFSSHFDVHKGAAPADGDVNFATTGNLSIGPLSGRGVDAASNAPYAIKAANAVIAGDVVLQAGGNLTLLENVSTLGSDITLVAGGAFQNPVNATLSPGGNGRWLIFAGNVDAEQAGGLAGSGPLPNLFNCSYGSACMGALPASGNGFVYAQQPQLDIVLVAPSPSRVYGAPNPSFASLVSGLRKGDLLENVLSGGYGTTAAAGSDVGSYAVTGSFVSPSGYLVKVTPGTLSVTPATLTYVAAPASRPVDGANPAFSGTVSGLVNGDTLAGSTSGTLAFTTTAPDVALPGPYAIAGGGLAARNYIFAQAPSNSGALTVTDAILTMPQINHEVAEASSALYGRNILTPHGCSGLGPMTAGAGGGLSDDILATEWSRVRGSPNLSNCMGMVQKGGCADF